MLTQEDLDIPLSALLAKCERAVEAAKGLRPAPAGSPEDAQIQHALDLVRAAEAASDAAGVLPSPGSGETADDIPAADLRFALLPHWAGELLASRAAGAGVAAVETDAAAAAARAPPRTPPGGPPPPPPPAVDPSTRAAALGAAAAEHRRFLTSIRLLGLLPPEARYALAGPAEVEEQEEEEEEEEGGGGRRGAARAGPDPAAVRAAKVAAFRARKALAASAAEVRGRMDAAAAAGEEPDPADAHAAAAAEVRLAALAAAEAAAAADGEAALLRSASRLPPSALARSAADHAAAGPPPDVVAALRAAADGLAGRGGGRAAAAVGDAGRPCYAPASALAGGFAPASLSAMASSHADRARLAAEVFRPSHILPTKTLAQQADEEVAAALERSAAGKRAAAAATAAKAEAGSDEEGLEADGGPRLAAARRMDDWKDDHPRGYGNSKLRPAAL